MLILEGCVQPGLSPTTNAATVRLLDRLDIGLTPVKEAGCCGAIGFHLNAQEAGRAHARQYRRLAAAYPRVRGDVTDDGGHLLGLRRLNGAAPFSADIAPHKARNAAIG